MEREKVREREECAWGGDWSYAYLESLVRRLQTDFRLHRLSAAREAISSGVPVAFVRHDIDVSLGRAVELARREAEWGIAATYHVMLCSPFYDVRSGSTRAALDAIASLGHEVGIHFYPPQDGSMTSAADADEVVGRACDQFEKEHGRPVRSVSIHMPAAALMGGPLTVAGRINAYAREFLGWYLSDSCGRWREGEPLVSLDAPRRRWLQLLIHPLWWGPENLTPRARLSALAEELAREQASSFESVASEIEAHILVRPRREDR